MKQLMSQAEYARHRDVNRSHICRLVQRGVLVLRGKLVDVAASDAVLDDKPVDVEPETAPAPQSRPVPDSAGQPSFARARMVDMTYRAKLRQLEFDRQRCALIDAAAVKKTISDAARGVRDGVLSIPDRLAATLAAEPDQKKIHSLL